MIKQPAASKAAAALLVFGLLFCRFTSDGDASDSALVAPLPATDPTFEVRWHAGLLSLSGHTQSQRHEQDLQQIAATEFPGAALSSNFEPLGIVPKYWHDMTAQVLYLLAESDSATALLSADSIDIRGITGENIGWQSRLDAVRNTLPAIIALTTDTLMVDSSINVDAVCQRAFENFDAGPINFEESSAVFRSSAYPRLQRVIALASTCQESRITITGHTDASGSESFNEQLSLDRAKAVGDYLVLGGLNEDRLLVTGQGSREPVADNATRYGRSLNRRIEIELTTWSGNDSLLGRR